MCGIAGIIKFGKEPIKEENISLLLVGNEHRGNDATGMAISQANGKIAVLKKDIPAWKFVTSEEYYKFIEDNLKEDSWGVILHARAATKGNPRQEENNHPLCAGRSAAIHNGVIRNDDNLFESLKLKRHAETDSDIIRAIVDEFGINDRAIKELGRIFGSVAGAVFDPKSPQTMLLLRSGSPLTLASDDNFFYFASERNTLHRAARPFVERFNMNFQVLKSGLAFAPMADDTAWIIGKEGLISHHEFRAMNGKYQEPIRKTYEEYSERQQHFDREKEKPKAKKNESAPAWCAKCKKEWVIPKGEDPREYTCPVKLKGCGAFLVPLPKLAAVN